MCREKLIDFLSVFEANETINMFGLVKLYYDLFDIEISDFTVSIKLNSGYKETKKLEDLTIPEFEKWVIVMYKKIK